MDMKEKEFYIDDDGIKLHAKLDMPESGGAGFPLVIVVHGYTGHMEEEHIVGVSKTMNGAGFATLRVEMYGHGKSGGSFKEHTLFKWISNLLKAVEYAETLEPVTDIYLCGHSQGGLLVMLIAGMRPDRFKAVIPLSPAWMIPEYARNGEFLGTSIDPDEVPDEFVQGGENVLSGNYIRAARMIHVEDEINRYKGPVLIIHGDRDEAVPYEYGVKAAKLYKNAKLVTVEGDDHCYDFHLDLVEKAVREFLTSLK